MPSKLSKNAIEAVNCKKKAVKKVVNRSWHAWLDLGLNP